MIMTTMTLLHLLPPLKQGSDQMKRGAESFIFFISTTQAIHQIGQVEVDIELWSNIGKLFKKTSGQTQQEWAGVDLARRGQTRLSQRHFFCFFHQLVFCFVLFPVQTPK